MRIVPTLLVLVCLAFACLAAGALVVAHAAEEEPSVDVRVRALELEIKYLRAREAALTKYVLHNEQRAQGLAQVAQRTREQGFTQAAIPYDSRETLLNGMSQLAQSLTKDLPAVTEAERRMKAAAEKFAKEHGISR